MAEVPVTSEAPAFFNISSLLVLLIFVGWAFKTGKARCLAVFMMIIWGLMSLGFELDMAGWLTAVGFAYLCGYLDSRMLMPAKFNADNIMPPDMRDEATAAEHGG